VPEYLLCDTMSATSNFFLVDFVVSWRTRRSWRRQHRTRTKLWGIGWWFSTDTGHWFLPQSVVLVRCRRLQDILVQEDCLCLLFVILLRYNVNGPRADVAPRYPLTRYLYQFRTSSRNVYLCLNQEGPDCASGYDAGLTNQTSLVRFPSPLNFS